MEWFKINKKQLIAGVISLLAGIMEYVVSRPVGSTYFLHKFTAVQSFFHHASGLYGELGNFAPDFFHPLAFSLISMAFVTGRRSRLLVCFSWFAIDSVFEIGQRYGNQFVEYFPKWVETLPIVKDLDSYLVNGRFDAYDLVAFGLGSATAFIVGELLSTKGGSNEKADPE